MNLPFATSAPTGLLSRVASFSIRHRLIVSFAWLGLVAVGLVGTLNLSTLLKSDFSLPGSDSSRVKALLATEFPSHDGSVVVLVAKGDGALARVRRAADLSAPLVQANRESVERLPSGAAVAFLPTHLAGGAAEARTSSIRRAVGTGIYVTGDAAVSHDLNPVLAHDLQVGELYLAVPAAFVILLLVFGSASAVLPFLFAAATVPPALGLAWAAAHVFELSSYLRNLVLMIGLGIAIDYSLLVVNRYRDERRRGLDHPQAVAETMAQAGRTILFSGLAVSVGLALMLLLPVPFLRGFGVGGLVIPVVSIVCALTLLPVLLATFGERLERVRVLPRAFAERQHRREIRVWAAHAHWVMRRAKFVAPFVACLLVVAALPLIGIRVGPGSSSSLPTGLPALHGLTVLRQATDSDTLNPTTVLVSSAHKGGASAARAALSRLTVLLDHDREVAQVGAPVVSRNGSTVSMQIVGRHDSSSPTAQAFADRLRNLLIPDARFPASVDVLAGGGAAAAADFISLTLGSFPWLIAGVLALTYLLLMRAFRSLLLPLKAIVMNLLTVSAASGLMIAAFQWGWGGWIGLTRVPQIEGWIPVFLFALLFGLSMDYEVFLVHRMREAWDATRSNHRAVVHGLSHTGRIVTAAGLIMVATFSGFLLGSIPPMQQLGFGLAVAILIDVTLVRGLLLPSAMALAGRWNWYLPAWTARAMRVPA